MFGELLNLDFSGLADLGSSVADTVGSVATSGADVLRSAGTDYWSNIFQNAPGAAETGGSVLSGLGDVARSVGSGVADFAKGVLPVAQVGAAGLGAVSSIQAAKQAAEQTRVARAGQQMAERALAPMTAFGEDAIARAQAGEIPEAQQAEIDQWAAAAKQQARDYLARAGQGDSSALRDWEDWIDARAVAMRNTALQGITSQGLDALGGAASGGTAIAQGATGRGDALQNLIAQANAQIARLSGSQAA